jgi:hypothetical protein
LRRPSANKDRFDKVKDMYAEIEKSKWTTALAGSAGQFEHGYFITPGRNQP